MKGVLLFLCIVFLLKHKVTYASMCHTQRYSELNVYLQGYALESFKVNTIIECYRKCEQNIHCASANINLMDMTCELKYSTKTRHPERNVSRPNAIYMEIRDDNAAQGSRSDIPIASCKKLKEDDSQAKSGVYWMKFNEPFQVFCDMTTDGGGWTLVYSYTFTQYSNFGSASNAMTPIPNWPVDRSSGTWVPQSTTTPLSESSRSAMDFAHWKKIGNEFLLKPNITNWVACVEGTGSLVNWVTGSLSCRVVKVLTPVCADVVPLRFQTFPEFPLLYTTGPMASYLVMVGKLTANWPTHDPCGNNSQNHLKNVQHPGGVLYLR